MISEKESEAELNKFKLGLYDFQFRVGQKSLSTSQLLLIRKRMSELLPKHAWEYYKYIELTCYSYDLEPPISLLELKNIKDYRVEQKLNELKKDFE